MRWGIGVRKLFSFPVAMCSILAALAVITVRDHFDNNDLWWHLRIGQVIWSTHAIPTQDLFSYSSFHHALVPQEWLSELSMYGAYVMGGLRGLMAWFCISTALLLILGYILSWSYSKNAKVALAGALAMWYFSVIGLAIRPQMISYVLFVVELLLIQAGRTRSPRWFWCLPIIFLIWVNCHASFILGMTIAAVYLGCSLMGFETRWLNAPHWEPVRRRTLAVSIVASAAALFINPTCFRQVLYPFDNLINMPSMLKSVEEWAPLTIISQLGLSVLAVLIWCLLSPFMSKTSLLIEEVILMGLAACLSFSHMRMLFIFGILVGPIFARTIAGSWENYDAKRDRMLPNAIVIGSALLIVVLVFPSLENLEIQVQAASPVRAVEFLRSHQLKGPMLNDYGYGGYLIWEIPEYPVFIDSRADLYEWTGIFDQYMKWSSLQTDPAWLPDKYGANLCLFPVDSNRDHILSTLNNWQRVYSDGQAVIYVRRLVAGDKAL